MQGLGQPCGHVMAAMLVACGKGLAALHDTCLCSGRVEPLICGSSDGAVCIRWCCLV